MKTRIERDSLGEVEVADDRLWGAQTQRSHDNFRIGGETMPIDVILALAAIKKAAARANGRLGVLAAEKVTAISEACDAILRRELDGQFPLSVWQTGSGTQSNMNVNEVIANYASAKAGRPLGSKVPLHPNDDVNRSQSSNDVFPAAMQLSAALKVRGDLLPAIETLRSTLAMKAGEFAAIVKSGRTHLQDAVPVGLGFEFAGYAEQLRLSRTRIEAAVAELLSLPLGGTAVGTGLNCPPGFAEAVTAELALISGLALLPADNKSVRMASHDDLVHLSGELNGLAAVLMKIGNDIRLMGSGPRCGFGELLLPENEPGSSIMPGKVNPTQVEALTMVCAQVFGNHATISFAGASGQLELNAFKPVIIYNLLQSIELLAGAMASFEERCVRGIVADRKAIARALDRNLMPITVLAPLLGYDAAAAISRHALDKDLSLRQAVVELEVMSAEKFDELVRPEEMAKGP